MSTDTRDGQLGTAVMGLRVGMTLAEAADFSGLDARALSGAASIQWRRRVKEAVEHAKEHARARDWLIRHRKPKGRKSLVEQDEIAFLEGALLEADGAAIQAGEDGSHVARARQMARVVELKQLLILAKKNQPQTPKGDRRPRLEEYARKMPDQDLEIFVREYTTRHKLTALHPVAG